MVIIQVKNICSGVNDNQFAAEMLWYRSGTPLPELYLRTVLVHLYFIIVIFTNVKRKFEKKNKAERNY